MFRIIFFLCCLLFLFRNLSAQKAEDGITLSGRIENRESGVPLSYATVQLNSGHGKFYGVITDEQGHFQIRNIRPDLYRIRVSFLGYHPFEKEIPLQKDDSITLHPEEAVRELNEVVVTASESKGITSASRIDREAMKHRQPSSFADLLSLLPGGMSAEPKFGQANAIRLREVGMTGENYDISSLGTSFIIDGLPVSSNANLQEVAQRSLRDNREYVNKGLDMRTLSTDQIESIEIIRGIPSVEYGDLTSGAVIIRRKLNATPWEARFKADGSGKLFSLDKGTTFGKRQLTVSGGLDYLDARPDPRNDFTSYKRWTGSLRLKKNRSYENILFSWQMNADYTGSFDNEKKDPEITVAKDDRYESTYNRMSLGNTFRIHRPGRGNDYLEFSQSLSFRHDRIRETKLVLSDRDRPVPVTLTEGEADGLFLPYNYTADVLVDGKPFTAYARLKGAYGLTTASINHRFTAGTEWNMDKNYGRGQVYDPMRPLNTTTDLRPRSYSAIPASHQLSFFVQDELHIPVAAHQLRLSAGIRGMILANTGQAYRMQGRMYIDPRINAQWIFPALQALNIHLSGGIGWHTKMPTLQQLHPDPIYYDLVQLNYSHVNPDYKRINLRTYIIDPTNYDLKPARNRKAEIRLGLELRQHQLSATWFSEDMHSGFRNTTRVSPFVYRKYDKNSIDGTTLQGPPVLEEMAWQVDTVLHTYGQTTNGSRILKKGVEFQYTSPRMEWLNTRFTVDGAWFRTTYSNSQAMYDGNVNTLINNVPVKEKYIGYYDWKDGYVKQQFTTKFMADTYLKEMGLTFSVTAECMWFNSTKRIARNGNPVSYMDVTGQVHPYTEADRTDVHKQWLVQYFDDALFRKTKEPFYMVVNFKATKDFGKFLTLALFVDRLLDYTPDYTQLGQTIRRNAKPYFGMEVNIRI